MFAILTLSFLFEGGYTSWSRSFGPRSTSAASQMKKSPCLLSVCQLYMATTEKHSKCYGLTYGLAKVTTVKMSLPSTLAIFESVGVCRQGKKWPDLPKWKMTSRARHPVRDLTHSQSLLRYLYKVRRYGKEPLVVGERRYLSFHHFCSESNPRTVSQTIDTPRDSSSPFRSTPKNRDFLYHSLVAR